MKINKIKMKLRTTKKKNGYFIYGIFNEIYFFVTTPLEESYRLNEKKANVHLFVLKSHQLVYCLLKKRFEFIFRIFFFVI